MKEVYAALLLHSAGIEINEENIKKVLSSVGIEIDENKIKALVASLEGVNIDEVIQQAQTIPTAAAAPAEEKKEEEKKEEEEKREEEAIAGLGALFG